MDSQLPGGFRRLIPSVGPHFAGHERVVGAFAAVEHQVQGGHGLHTGTVLPLGFQQRDLVDVLFGSPVRVAEAEDGVELADVEPVEGQVEADDGVGAEPFDHRERLADRTPLDLVEDDGAVLLGVLQRHHHALLPAAFAIDVDLISEGVRE